MPMLLAALDAFLQEHRRCGELDGGVEGERVWMTCQCRAELAPVVGGASRHHEGRGRLDARATVCYLGGKATQLLPW